MKHLREQDARGLTGVGILILFIALVIVGAMAAGVILENAGYLRSLASDTGEDSTRQVSDRVQSTSQQCLADLTGTRGAKQVTVFIRLVPGGEVADLSTAVVEYRDEDMATYLEYGQSADAQNFTVKAAAQNATNPLLDESDDVRRVVLNLTAIREAELGTTDDPLPQGSEASLTIVPASGATTTVTLDIPKYVDSDSTNFSC